MCHTSEVPSIEHETRGCADCNVQLNAECNAKHSAKCSAKLDPELGAKPFAERVPECKAKGGAKCNDMTPCVLLSWLVLFCDVMSARDLLLCVGWLCVLFV